MLDVSDKQEELIARLSQEFSVPVANGYIVKVEPLSANIISFAVYEALNEVPNSKVLPKPDAIEKVARAIAKFISVDYYSVLVTRQVLKSKLGIPNKDKARVIEFAMEGNLYTVKSASSELTERLLELGVSKAARRIIDALWDEKEIYSIDGIVNFRLPHMLDNITVQIANALELLANEKDTWEFLNFTKTQLLGQKPLKDEVHVVIDDDENILVLDKEMTELSVFNHEVIGEFEVDGTEQIHDIMIGVLICFVPKQIIVHNPYDSSLLDEVTYKMILEVFSHVVRECEDCGKCEITGLV